MIAEAKSGPNLFLGHRFWGAVFPGAKVPGPFHLVAHDLHSLSHLMPNMVALALAITSVSLLAGRGKKEGKGHAPALQGVSAYIPLTRTLSLGHILL